MDANSVVSHGMKYSCVWTRSIDEDLEIICMGLSLPALSSTGKPLNKPPLSLLACALSQLPRAFYPVIPTRMRMNRRTTRYRI